MKQKRLDILDCVGISDKQAEMLCNPVIINYLRQQQLTISQAKELTEAAYTLLRSPAYCDILRQGRTTTPELLKVKNQQASILIYPSIATLIQRGKLPFQTAKQLPLFAKPFFSNPAYLQYFASADVDWTLFHKFYENHYRLMLTKPFIESIITNQLTFNDVYHIPSRAIPALLEHHSLAIGFCLGTISVSDLSSKNNRVTLPVMASSFAVRLNATRKGNPKGINEQFDSIKSLMLEIKTAADKIDSLYDEIIERLVKIINEDIKIHSAVSPGVYSQFLLIMIQIEDPNPSWHKVFSQLIKQAREISQVKIDPITFFRPNKRMKFENANDSDEIMTFCKKLLCLAPLDDLLEQEALLTSTAMDI